jgi:hypothetical protein
MALYTDFTLRLVAELTGSLDLATPKQDLDNTTRYKWATGTGADHADKMYTDENTLSASDTANVDLAGSLADGFGGTITFARIKMVVVKAAAGNTNDVQVTRPGSLGAPLFLAAGDGIPVKPGGLFAWVAPGATGVAVTAGSADLLTFTNSAGSTSVTYDLIIIGASA